MKPEQDWKAYQAKSREYPPNALVERAVSLVYPREQAIDIGAGALRDSRYLLEMEFEHVTALDGQTPPIELIDTLDPERFEMVTSDFIDFSFPVETYDLATALYALPFNPPKTFKRVLQRIKCSLKPGGILCMNLFGDRDGWNHNPELTILTKDKAWKLLDDMEVLSFEDREWNNKLANGTPKHWHTFDIIARRP